MASCQKVQKFDFKVNFLCQKSSESLSTLFALRNTTLEVYFLLLTFFNEIKIQKILLLK